MRIALVLVVISSVSQPAFAKDAKTVFDLVSRSIVKVEAFSEAPQRLVATGSGVVLSDGLIVTNCHVIEKGGSYVVSTGGGKATAKVRAGNPDLDLCLLDHEPLNGLKPATISRRAQVATGERVFAIGNPLGLENTISEGIVSAVRQSEGLHLIQTTAAISPGSSGGGLFNANGELIGITTFQFKGQNLNFAISAAHIEQARLSSAPPLARDRIEQRDDGPQWVRYFEGAGATSYYDRRTIRRDGHLIFVTGVHDSLIRSRTSGEITGKRSLVIRSAYDCAAQTFALVSATTFLGGMGTGDVEKRFAIERDRWRFEAIPAKGTIAGNLAAIVCRE